MKKTYEEQVTEEIRRVLRHLNAACKEQNISMEQAVEWYKGESLQIETIEEDLERNPNLPYEERAERFARKYVNGQQKKICVAALCYAYNQEQCPDGKSIIEAVTSKIEIITSSKDRIPRIVAEALAAMMNNSGLCQYNLAKSWASLKHVLFKLAKSL